MQGLRSTLAGLDAPTEECTLSVCLEELRAAIFAQRQIVNGMTKEQEAATCAVYQHWAERNMRHPLETVVQLHEDMLVCDASMQWMIMRGWQGLSSAGLAAATAVVLIWEKTRGAVWACKRVCSEPACARACVGVDGDGWVLLYVVVCPCIGACGVCAQARVGWFQ